MEINSGERNSRKERENTDVDGLIQVRVVFPQAVDFSMRVV